MILKFSLHYTCNVIHKSYGFGLTQVQENARIFISAQTKLLTFVFLFLKSSTAPSSTVSSSSSRTEMWRKLCWRSEAWKTSASGSRVNSYTQIQTLRDTLAFKRTTKPHSVSQDTPPVRRRWSGVQAASQRSFTATSSVRSSSCPGKRRKGRADTWTSSASAAGASQTSSPPWGRGLHDPGPRPLRRSTS